MREKRPETEANDPPTRGNFINNVQRFINTLFH